MCQPAIPPHLTAVALDMADVHPTEVLLTVHAESPSAACPICGESSTSVHSRYERRVADLPLGGRTVILHLRARRFYCHVGRCPRRVFCERLPALVRAHGRRTEALRMALVQVGFALGGNPGARLALTLGMPTSRATVLRLIRATPPPSLPTPRLLGLDDWAQKRGCTYGTILVDLETHLVVDLLPDRAATTVAAWLRARSGSRSSTWWRSRPQMIVPYRMPRLYAQSSTPMMVGGAGSGQGEARMRRRRVSGLVGIRSCWASRAPASPPAAKPTCRGEVCSDRRFGIGSRSCDPVGTTKGDVEAKSLCGLPVT